MKYSGYRRAMQLLTRPARKHGHDADFIRIGKELRRHTKRWLLDTNVIGFGVGNREAAGKDTGELALRVHVLRKLPTSRLTRNRIPPVVHVPGLSKPILLDVVESRIPRAQLAFVGDGLSLSGSREFGTIGCVVRRRGSNDLFGVTCAHVLVGNPGTTVEWAEFPPATALPNPRIGALTPFRSPLSAGPGFPNNTDVSLVRLDPAAVTPVVRFLGAIAGIRTTPLVRGEVVTLCGFGTSVLGSSRPRGVCAGAVIEPHTNRVVDFPGHGEFGFRDVVECTGFTLPMDSGAGVLDSQNRLVGIHFAGPDLGEQGTSFFQPIANVFGAFGLSFATNVDAPPDAPAAHAAGATEGRGPPAVGARAIAIDTMARTLWGEARGEVPAGQRGVANVILNRVAKDKPQRFGATVENVCRKPMQFSCWNQSDPNRAKLLAVTDANEQFRQCLELARTAVNGSLSDNTRGSDHYHTAGVAPSWSKGHVPAAVLGSHRFFNDIP
jgi:N-acetylmuramoyl-L-alanine amidase